MISFFLRFVHCHGGTRSQHTNNQFRASWVVQPVLFDIASGMGNMRFGATRRLFIFHEKSCTFAKCLTHPKMDSPILDNGGQPNFHFRKSESGHLLHVLSYDRAENGGKTESKHEGSRNGKLRLLCDIRFSFREILQNTCCK